MTKLHWLEQSAAEVAPSNSWLSPSEQLRLAEMKVLKRRNDWRLGRWAAKLAVAQYFQLPTNLDQLAMIEIRAHESGAPEAFLNNEAANVSISLSHRDGMAICGVTTAGVALGCDLELVEPRSEAFVADYFAPEEQSTIAQSNAMQRDLLVTVLWSAKESALKALRTGLRLDTRCVVATLKNESLSGTGTWSPLSVLYGNQVFAGWWTHRDPLVRTTVSAPAVDMPTVAQSPLSPAKGNGAPSRYFETAYD